MAASNEGEKKRNSHTRQVHKGMNYDHCSRGVGLSSINVREGIEMSLWMWLVNLCKLCGCEFNDSSVWLSSFLVHGLELRLFF